MLCGTICLCDDCGLAVLQGCELVCPVCGEPVPESGMWFTEEDAMRDIPCTAGQNTPENIGILNAGRARRS